MQRVELRTQASHIGLELAYLGGDKVLYALPDGLENVFCHYRNLHMMNQIERKVSCQKRGNPASSAAVSSFGAATVTLVFAFLSYRLRFLAVPWLTASHLNKLGRAGKSRPRPFRWHLGTHSWVLARDWLHS